jgi:hypothetical protein
VATQLRPPSACGGVHRVGGHVGHRTRHRFPIPLDGHRHRVRLDAVDEVHGAVDRIEHPRQLAGARVGGAALLLTEDVFTGPVLGEPVAQQPFGLGVDDGHRVGRRALGGHRARGGVTGGGAEHLAAPGPHECRGVGGQLLGHLTQHHRVVVQMRSGVHPAIASCPRAIVAAGCPDRCPRPAASH